MKIKFLILTCISIAVIIIGVGIGSVAVSPPDVAKILFSRLPFIKMTGIEDTTAVIIWRVRFPRVLTAFVCGGALAITGVIMQSCLKNFLASAYTIGVSSGASLFAACSLFFTNSLFQMLSLPAAGSLGAILSTLIVIKFSQAVDKHLSDNTIILVGMTFSLFVNAVLTVLVSLNRDKLGHLLFWQMGNFGWHGWSGLTVMFPLTLIAFLFLQNYATEADILTFGDEQAISMGLNVQKLKTRLLAVSSLLTGIIVAFVGVIGFVDLIAPHIVRKFFGSRHALVLPSAFLFGGTLMAVCDLIARTVLSPIELPVGAVTALIGAPFFAYIFFKRRKNA